MKRLSKYWIWITLLVVLIAGASYAYRQRTSTQAPQTRYQFASISEGSIIQNVAANGTLNPVTLVNVGTQVSGTVKRLLADFNDRVDKGQVLLELDPSLLTAQVNQSKANVLNATAALNLARSNEERNRSLFDRKYISHQAFDTVVEARQAAEAQLAVANAQLAKDNVNLGYTVIRSPVSGVVVNRAVDIGQTVAASFQTPTLFQIAEDLSKMQADTSFAEADIGNIRVGQTAHFNVDAFPDRGFHGAVKRIRLNPTTQQNVVTYDVVISVANPGEILLPGMTAYVNIAVAQREHAVLVPNAALRFKLTDAAEAKPASGQGASRRSTSAPTGTVYVLAGEKLKPVSITVGITDGRNTEVTSGDLKPGDKAAIADLQSNAEPSGGTIRFRMF